LWSDSTRAGVQQVPQIRARPARAHRAGAVRIERNALVAVPRVAQVEPPARGEHRSVSPVAGRHDAVEEVDATRDRGDQVLGQAESHQVARRGGRKRIERGRDQARAFVRRLTDAEPADRERSEAERSRARRALHAQLRRAAALNDSEEQLIRAPVDAAPALRPAQRALEAGARAREVGWRLGRDLLELVEHDDQVRAELLLDLDRALGREKHRASVERALELDAGLAASAERVEREHLEAARVREHRAVPAHEAVQPAVRRDQLLAGPQVQMIGVREHALHAHPRELVRSESAHSAERGDGEEGRRLEHAVRGEQPARARRAVARGELEARGPGASHWIHSASPYE
jgi:hypothetical protein